MHPKSQFPDILSAPAPILRDQDILIDGETVDHLPSPATYQQPAFRPSPVHNPSYSHSHHHHPATSPAMSSLTTSPTSASPPTQYAPSSSTPSSSYSPSYGGGQTQSYQNGNNGSNQFAFPNQYSQNPRPTGGGDGRTVVSHRGHAGQIATRPPEVAAMRSRRKVATVASGVAGGVIGLAILGPVGALAGGFGGAMLTKQAGRRMERKQTERIAAQRDAAEERRYGHVIPAHGDDHAIL
jgi:hypothetical protein